jgi:hypothetical protein
MQDGNKRLDAGEDRDEERQQGHDDERPQEAVGRQDAGAKLRNDRLDQALRAKPEHDVERIEQHESADAAQENLESDMCSGSRASFASAKPQSR